jgi:hypothetical protein
MPRSISYSPLALAAVPGGKSPRAKKPDDDYQQRLLKYIPAETIAFFVPISAAVGDKSRSGLVVITLVAIAGNVLYSFIGKAPGGKTLPHYYVLSIIAFLVWALATDQSLADLIGLNKLWTSIILGCTVFILPGLDALLARWNV